MALLGNQIALIICYVLLVVLAIIAVVLRFYTIYYRGRSTKAHDWLCVVSLLMLVGYAIDTMIGTISGGIGYHITQMEHIDIELVLKVFFASQWMWSLSIATFRLAILLLYLELFPTKYFRWGAYTLIFLVVAFYIATIGITSGICHPIAFSWDKTIVGGTCGDEATAELAAAGINMGLDVLIVLLPMPVVWTLQMSTEKKLGVTVTFAMGLTIAAINLARIFLVLDCSLLDFTYCTLNSAILTVAEMAVGIIVACIPTLGPIFFPKRYQSRYSKNNKNWLGKTAYTSTALDTSRQRLNKGSSGYSRFLRHWHSDDLNSSLQNGSTTAKVSSSAHTDVNDDLEMTPQHVDAVVVRTDVDVTAHKPRQM